MQTSYGLLSKTVSRSKIKLYWEYSKGVSFIIKIIGVAKKKPQVLINLIATRYHHMYSFSLSRYAIRIGFGLARHIYSITSTSSKRVHW